MSLIRSHERKIDEYNSYEPRLSVANIKDIVGHIINKHASLIVDIETNQASPDLLYQEINKYLNDTNFYHMKKNEVIKDVWDYMFGYGLLQAFIDDDNVTDIDVCRYDFILIKKHGYKEIAQVKFEDEDEFTNFCKLVVIRNGGIINENDCHARISDQNHRLRINVSIAPRNVIGTSMTIRKHRMQSYTLSDLISLRMLNEETGNLLRHLMVISSRLVIVGKGASGKTTLLRALLREVPITERFLVCESESELYPENPNFIVQKVESRQGKKSELKRLIRDGLTMSLDGYCIGELVGDEVYEFVKAGYTDHRVLGTLHAFGIEETIPRMISMIDKDVKNNMLEFIGKSLDIVVYMKKFKVMEVAEIHYDKDLIINTLIQFDVKIETDSSIDGYPRSVNPIKYRLKSELVRKQLW